MLHLKKTGLLLIVLMLIFSCKKSGDDKDYNVLKINSGSNAGFVQVYSPNMGFWSEAGQEVRYVHLVFGSTDNMVTIGKDIMSVLFYYEGTSNVTFPSAQGQHCNIGVTINGAERYYTAEDATLSISEMTDDRLKGSISGTFISNGPEFESVVVSMDIDILLDKL